MKILKNDWNELLGQEFQKPYYIELKEFLISEYQSRAIYPDKHHIFNALHFTPYSQTKVVILGQDPSMVRDRPMVSAFLFSLVLHHPHL